MTKIWEHLKDNAGWIYFGIFLALGAWGLAIGDEWYWSVMDVVAGLFFLYLYQFGPFARPRKVNVDLTNLTEPEPEHIAVGPDGSLDDCPGCVKFVEDYRAAMNYREDGE